ncbi:MAG: amidohydrolase [Clostridiaceae bacterium]|nr:amidohydrolase [Clostridiaceae bacterium]
MDLILTNGNITTMDADYPKVEAIAVKDGKFAMVGGKEEVLSFKTSDTTIIDLEGKMLLPGFNDSHMHLLNYGYSLQKASLIGSGSIEEVITRTKDFIAQKHLASGQWVLGRGWNQDLFQVKKFPTREDLDKISLDHPICLTRACEHVLVVNSKALELAGVTKDTPQVEGGHFDLDQEGNPIGIFREKALDLIYRKIPKPEVKDIKEMILAGAHKALQQGITSIQTDDFEALPGREFKKVLQAYEELQSQQQLPVRIYQQCLLPHIDKLNTFLDLGYRTGKGDEFFKIGPLKLLGDGSLGARTAYLCEAYADDTSTQGIPIFTQEELDRLVITAHKEGMQLAIHAIGDKMMYMAFDSIEKALTEKPRKDHRHGIIHCQITDETLLNKYKEMDVLAYIQPIFINYDLHIIEDRVGVERSKTTYNWKTMFDIGVHVACSSDCPVEPLDVLPGIYAAVTRKGLDGFPKDGWLPEQKLTLDQALHGFTLGAAYASFEEGLKGSITVGKLADMVVLEKDLYEIHPDEIKDVDVKMTFVGGKLAYEKI